MDGRQLQGTGFWSGITLSRPAEAKKVIASEVCLVIGKP
jgi:hypothetical protein